MIRGNQRAIIMQFFAFSDVGLKHYFSGERTSNYVTTSSFLATGAGKTDVSEPKAEMNIFDKKYDQA